MKRFFDNIDSIHRYTSELHLYQNKHCCHHCFKNDQFISHGFIYKQRSLHHREKIGKRIFCSNRYGHSGCGKTFRLSIANEIPSLRYNTVHLFTFLQALLLNYSVKNAYQQATGQLSSRNAWRWLNKFMSKLTLFRGILQTRYEPMPIGLKPRSRRLQILLPTIHRLFKTLHHNPFSSYQQRTQLPVI